MYRKQNESTDVREGPGIHGGDGVITRRGFFRGVSRLPVTFEVWDLEPGVSEGSHTHGGEHALEEIYYFLQGSGVMWVDGEDVPVAAGDAIMVGPGSDHGFRNTGNETLKVVLLWGMPDPGRQ